MSTILFYNYQQTPSEGHRITIRDKVVSNVILSKIKMELTSDENRIPVAYVEDVESDLEHCLLLVGVSRERTLEVLACEYVTAEELCLAEA